jgi:hypothetical protein
MRTRALGDEGRVVKQVAFPRGHSVAVVAEGEFEPRSVGSYTIRLYNSPNPAFPFDNFVAGIVRPRNGVVEDVGFVALERSAAAALVVIVRSAGSGGYRSADAFDLTSQRITLIGSVSGLAPNVNPIEALRRQLILKH